MQNVLDIDESKNGEEVFNVSVLGMHLVGLAEFGGKGER